MHDKIEKLNYVAVMDTLSHQGQLISDLVEASKTLQAQLNTFRQELAQQRGLIVNSLQQKYGHGSTEK
ncbi:MAG: hypothetical protein AMS22_05100 [Thiotrichales bacterium SG8_50]|nr:MAG: hypothetical protein AMS22_05100 [Thiotrichales bacterium SG8_50]